MHISEGILGAGTCLAGYGGTAVLTAWGLKKTTREKIPATAVMGAAFFAASLIHFKVGVTSVHLTLLGLTAIVLGAPAVPAIIAGLFFQAVMFQHGGITTLGVNGVIMAGPALAGQYLFRKITASKKENRRFVSITAGLVSALVLLSATVLAALVILVSGEEFRGIALFFTAGNLVLSVIEGIITAFIVSRILKIKPEMIGSWD